MLATISTVMHDPELWTRPETFDPERFSPARAEDKQIQGAFLPFGTGAHACLGSQLATLEAQAFWHTLLTRCSFKLARPYADRHQFRPLGMISGDVELALTRLG